MKGYRSLKVLGRNVLVAESIRHGDAVLVDIRASISLHASYFSPYLTPPEPGILKERVMA